MNSVYILLLTALFFSSCSSSSTVSTNPVKQDENKSIEAITPQEYQNMLKSGMDVDWAKTTQGRDAIKKARNSGINVPKLFKERGLSHVRIRVKDDVLSDETLLDEIEKAVDESQSVGLIPIVAYQAAEFKDDPTNDEVTDSVVLWWEKVANRLKSKPYSLAYDIIIETTGEVKKHNDRLNLLYQKVVTALRKIDPKRILIIAPNKISNPYELPNLQIPQPSDHLMVEWHFYAAGPKKDNPKKQWTTGTEQEKKLITDKIDSAFNWSKEHNIPTWVGAWMANNYNDINKNKTYPDGAPAGGEYSIEEQKKFASFMVGELKKRNIPYAVNSDTKYFDRVHNRWYDSVKEVLDIMIWK